MYGFQLGEYPAEGPSLSYMRMACNFYSMSMAEIQICLRDGCRRVDEGAVHIEQDSFDLYRMRRHGGTANVCSLRIERSKCASN